MERIGDAIILGALYTVLICGGVTTFYLLLVTLLMLAQFIGWWLAIPFLVFVGASLLAYLDNPGAQKSG